MKPGDLVVVEATGTVASMSQNGKIGLILNFWVTPDYLGGDIFVDVLVDGVKMSFHSDELRLIEEIKNDVKHEQE
jgi:hypothetical protein